MVTSDTPRTDDLISSTAGCTPAFTNRRWIEFARQLERELKGFIKQLGCDDPTIPPSGLVVLAMAKLVALQRELAEVYRKWHTVQGMASARQDAIDELTRELAEARSEIADLTKKIRALGKRAT